MADVLGDPLDLVRWWPSVFLSVQEVDPPSADGTGRRLRVHTRGWLPYTLVWEFVVTEHYYPNRMVLDTFGDFVGRGTWTFVQDGPVVNVVHDWRVRAEKPVLRHLSFMLRPLFETNQRWAMAQGEESLQLELVRRRTIDEHQRAAVPAPPGPVTYAGAVLAGSAALAGTGVLYLWWRWHRRHRARR